MTYIMVQYSKCMWRLLLSSIPETEVNHTARRIRKKALRLLAQAQDDLKGSTVNSSRHIKVTSMDISKKKIAVNVRAAIGMARIREAKSTEANHRQSRVPGCAPCL